MKTEKSTFEQFATLNAEAFYLLDYSKISSVDDIKAILEAVAFNFVGNHPRINTVKHLLDLNNPLLPPPQFEVETDLSKLDELKTEEYGPGL
jgi:hypothetical protein